MRPVPSRRPAAGAGAALDFSPPTPARSFVRVGQLVARLQVGLQETFPNRFWVEGEVSNFKVSPRGFAFFALKEKDAQVEAVIWRDRLARLAFTPEDGSLVLALVRKVDFYAPQGRLRVHVDDLEPQGVGALAKALEERKARLQAEGLFDESRKRPVPMLPRVIGVATAAGSAALRDLVETLEQRFAERRILLRPCRVQGKGAAEDIAAALDDLNREGSADVILLGRGGGSAEDLWCFNEEVVVRAIARSRIPIIAGIGHEVDWTLADLAADLRVATPTAAAQRCLPERRELETRLSVLGRRLHGGLSGRLELARARIAAGRSALGDPRAIVTRRLLRLETMGARAREALLGLTSDRRGRLERAGARLCARRPRTDLHTRGLVQLGQRLETGLASGVRRSRTELSARAAQLEALSPLAVLGRGFAVARREDGAIVRDAATLAPGEDLSLRFARGAARTRVLEVDPGATTAMKPGGNDDEEPRG